MTTFEINVPIENKNEKIKTRISDFKKYGLQNIKDHKIKLYLLASKDNEKGDLCEGWPDGVEPIFIRTPYHHVAQRVFYYYSSIIEPDRADWYIRIDEDSMTDIDGLSKILESRYDHLRDYHLAGHVAYDPSDLDKNLLSLLGFSDWYRHGDNPGHEIEVSVTSNAAIQKFASNSLCKRYLEMRQEFAEGYGDQGFCHALRMCKIYSLHTKFLTHDPDIYNFSIFGGSLNHIHHISRDSTPVMLEWYDVFTGELDDNVVNKVFFLGSAGEKKLVKFYDDNCVCNFSGKRNDTIGLWCKKENKILVYSHMQKDKIMHLEKFGSEYSDGNFKMTLVNQ